MSEKIYSGAAKAFIKSMDATFLCASKDEYRYRYHINGVLIARLAGRLGLVATDGHVIVVHFLEVAPKERHPAKVTSVALVQPDEWRLIKAHLAVQKGEIEIAASVAVLTAGCYMQKLEHEPSVFPAVEKVLLLGDYGPRGGARATVFNAGLATQLLKSFDMHARAETVEGMPSGSPLSVLRARDHGNDRGLDSKYSDLHPLLFIAPNSMALLMPMREGSPLSDRSFIWPLRALRKPKPPRTEKPAAAE